MLSKNTWAQIAMENSYSRKDLVQECKALVGETDLESLVEAWAMYMSRLLDATELEDVKQSRYAQYHYELMSSVENKTVENKTSVLTLIRKALEVLVVDHVTSKGTYIDRSAVAMQIGMKCSPKTVIINGEVGKVTKVIKLSIGLNVVQFLTESNIVRYKTTKSTDGHSVVTLELNQSLADDLKELRLQAYNVRTGKPMIAEPKAHTTANEGGLYTQQQTMLKGATINHEVTQQGLCLDAINKLQQVPYAVVDSLPFMDEYQLEPKWYDSEFKFMDGEWMKLQKDIELARTEGCFYANFMYDFRGRIYDGLSYINLQGDTYQKAMVEFASKETLTEAGIVNLKVAVASELYSDKVSREAALEWFELNQHKLNPTTPIGETLVTAWKRHLRGEAIGTITRWDATNSGLQFYSVLGRDKVGAALCNVINNGTIADAYNKLLDTIQSKVTLIVEADRNTFKDAFMIYLYGAMKERVLNQVIRKGVNSGRTIKSVFPNCLDDDAIWEVFTSSMSEIAPATVELMNLIYSYQDLRTHYEWTMPDGFKVHYSPTETIELKGYYFNTLQGKAHEGSVKSRHIEANKYSRALAPNVIHSIDSYFLREVVRRCDFGGVQVIHDSFGVHPNNVDALLQIAREVMADITDSNLLEDILTQLNPDMTRVRKLKGKFINYGELTREDVLASVNILR